MNLFHIECEMRMVFKINTLIAAYQFAKELKETSCGKDVYEGFYRLKERLSDKAWSIYRDVIYTCKFDHYFCFGIAYKKIELSQSEKDNAYLRDVFVELRDCSELHSFIKLSDKLARDLEQSYIDLNKNLPIMGNEGARYSFELYRAWLDLFYNLHNTKIFYYLHTKIGNERLKDESIKNYLEQREVYPFSSRNRRLIRRLGGNEHDQRDMRFLEFFESTRRNVFQLIYEIHLDFHLEIDKEEVIQFREKEFDKIRAYKVKINGIRGFSRGDFLILYEDGKLQDIGIIQRKTVIDFEKGEKALSIITALLYPRTDQELFFYDLMKAVDN